MKNWVKDTFAKQIWVDFFKDLSGKVLTLSQTRSEKERKANIRLLTATFMAGKKNDVLMMG